MTKYFSIKFIAVVAIALLIGIGQAFAQSAVTGAISGKITDPQGSVVPNAAITITNTATNKSVTINAADDGAYKATNLEPGKYRVETNVSGFAPAKAENIIVEVGQTTPVDIPLTLGTTEANVEVTAEAPVINTNDNANATNINQTSISELPINGRRASDFARLTPGVNPDGDFGLNSFRGLSGLLNNSTLDGTDNNNTFFSEERGRTRIQYSVSQAAVREFQVNNTNYSAEYGRAAGGVINTVTKSGTNDFHGELFYFNRNNKWGSRNPSALLPTPTGLVAIKPKDERQQFGGAIGGPIIKDRLFFFFTYDQQKRDFPGVGTPANANAFNDITVAAPPTSRVCPGVTPGANQTVTTAPGEILSCRGLSQQQVTDQLTFLRSLTGTTPREQNQRILFPKIDWIVNSRNTVSASYNYLRTKAPNGFQTPSVVNVGIAGFGNDFVDVDTFNSRLTTTITSSMVNEFRFQFGREFARSFIGTLTAGEQALAAKAAAGSLFNGLLPQISISSPNTFQFGTSINFQRNAFPNERTIQFTDSLTSAWGNHGFKFGTDIKFTRDKVDNLRAGAGGYSYNNVTDLITDLVFPSQRRWNSYQQGFGLAAYTLKTPDYAFFVQDDWRITPHLTINLGLRWDYQSYGSPKFPNTTAATLAAGETRYTQAQADAIIAQTGHFPSDKNNFGPRVGAAWDITGDGKTTLRGGYGIYYGRIPNTFLSSPFTNTGAPGSQFLITNIFNNSTIKDANGNVIPLPTLPNGLSTQPVGINSITVMSPNWQNPMIHEGDVIFERQIASNTAVSISYIFSIGRDIPQFVDLNLPVPATTRTYTVSGGPLNGLSFTTPFFGSTNFATSNTPSGIFGRPISNFGSIIEGQSTSKSRYNGLVLQANRRLTHGLQFQVNYTWSRATDQGQQLGTFAPSFPTVSNPFDRSIDEGRSDLDITHRFVASAVWEVGNTFGLGKEGVGRAIFGGFTVSPIVNIASGRPVTPFINASPNGRVNSGLLGSGGPQRLFFLPRGLDNRPSTATVDLRVSKRIRFTENMNLELLAEGFNIFNRSNVTGINDAMFTLTAATNTLVYQTNYLTTSTTGINNNLIFTPRQIQLGARFHF
jgi:outer membrane receptor protein involved in Fe transport